MSDEQYRERERKARLGPYDKEEREWLRTHSPYRRDLAKIRELEEEIKKLHDALDERRKTCQHIWIDGGGWEYKIEDCVLCGKSEAY